MTLRAIPPALAALPRPARGSSTRLQIGAHELVLEGARGGFALLWSDGREARRFQLGLPPGGELQLQLAAPGLPLSIVPRDSLVLAPGGRLRGYLQLPLVPTLLLVAANGATQQLLSLPTPDLQAAWDEASGSHYSCVSPWHLRYPMRSGEARAIAPLVLHNDDPQVCQVAALPLAFATGDLRSLRESLVLPPQRLRLRKGAWCSDRKEEAAR